MIDTDRYEGHTPAPWKASHDVLEYGHIVNNNAWRVYVGEHEKRAEIENHTFDHDDLSEKDARLIADAPLFLEEVKRLYVMMNVLASFNIVKNVEQGFTQREWVELVELVKRGEEE